MKPRDRVTAKYQELLGGQGGSCCSEAFASLADYHAERPNRMKPREHVTSEQHGLLEKGVAERRWQTWVADNLAERPNRMKPREHAAAEWQGLLKKGVADWRS